MTTKAAGPARELTFETLAEAVDEAQRLLDRGYRRTGNWSLAQVAGHCAQWIEYSMSGVYPVPRVMRPIFAVVSWTIGPRLLRSTLAKQKMASGSPTFPESVPADEPDMQQHFADMAAVDLLRNVVQRFKDWDRPLARSPIFGRLSKGDATALHCLHLAHHLGFLVPRDTA